MRSLQCKTLHTCKTLQTCKLCTHLKRDVPEYPVFLKMKKRGEKAITKMYLNSCLTYGNKIFPL